MVWNVDEIDWVEGATPLMAVTEGLDGLNRGGVVVKKGLGREITDTDA